MAKLESVTHPLIKKLLEGLKECDELLCPDGQHLLLLCTCVLLYIYIYLDGKDVICLQLLIRLLQPRGLGKNVAFLKFFEVI